MGNFVVILLVGLLIIVAFSVIIIYNSLINRKNQVENSLGSIDAMLKKRFDLIPNLVDTVKVFMEHEKGIFESLTQLRNNAYKESSTDTLKLDSQMSKAMGNFFAVAENYPELKSSNNFLQLQAAWNESEEQISAARRFYNAAVTDYNNAVEMFPSNIIAGMLKYRRREVFTVTETERTNISAKKLFGN